MRIRLNFRFAIIMFVSVAVIATATHFLHAYQVQRMASSFLDRATQMEKQEQLDKAVDYVSRYVALVPTDEPALERLAALLVDERLGKSQIAKRRAKLVLEKVLYSQPKRHDVRRQLIKLNVELGGYTDAGDDLDKYLLAETEFKNDSELRYLRGLCFDNTGKFKDARTQYEMSVNAANPSLEAYLRLAYLLRRHPHEVVQGSETPEQIISLADQTITAMIVAKADNAIAHLEHAAYFKSINPNEDVSKQIDEAKRLAPDLPKVVIAVAGLSMERAEKCRLEGEQAQRQSILAKDQGDAQKEREFADRAAMLFSQQKGYLNSARETLQRGCKIHEKDYLLCQALAQLEAGLGQRPDSAIACLREGINKMPGKVELLWDLAELSAQAGKKDDALDAIAQLRRAGFLDVDLAYLTAQLSIAEKQWVRAAEQLEIAYPRLLDRSVGVNDPTVTRLVMRIGFQLGGCYEKIGDSNRAVGIYTRNVTTDPRDVASRIALARALTTDGRLSEALEQYQHLVRMPNASPAYLYHVANLVLARNQSRPIEDQKSFWPDVDRAIAQAEQLRPLPTEVVVLRAQYHAAKQEFDKAQEVLTSAFADPKSRPATVWASLAELKIFSARQKAANSRSNPAAAGPGEKEELAAALSTLDEAEKILGDQIIFRMVRAQYWMGQDREQARKALASLAEKLDRFSNDEKAQLLSFLGTCKLLIGDVQGAVRDLEIVAQDLLPFDLRTRLTLFEIALVSRDDAAMSRWRDELKAIEPSDGALWRYARARQQVARAFSGQKADFTEARSDLAVASIRRPDWSRVVVCQAFLDDLEGHPELALPNYVRGLSGNWNDPIAIARAARLLHDKGRFTEANRLFGRVPSSLIVATGAQQAAADAAWRARDISAAKEILNATSAADSKDYRQLLWVARMNWNTGESEKAEEAFAKARDLARAAPEAWVAIIDYLIATGQAERARNELESAKAKLKQSNHALVLARCLELTGDVEHAGESYQAALTAAPNDVDALYAIATYSIRMQRLDDAEKHLRKLMELTRTKSPETSTVARRMIAAILSAKGDPAKAKEAMELLATSTGGNQPAGASDGDLRLRAQLMANQPSAAQRRESLRIFEDLIERQVGTEGDYAGAAQLYESIGDWPNASKRYRELVDNFESASPLSLYCAARGFALHGDIGRSENVHRRMIDTKAPATLTREIEARILFAKGQKEQAAAMIKGLAGSEGTSLQGIAGLLAEFGDQAGAEEILRRFVEKSKHADSVLALARQLIQNKKFEEALDLCDKAVKTCSPTAVVDVYLMALDAVGTDETRFNRIEKQLESLVQRESSNTALIVALANSKSVRGKYDDAIKLYRRALELNPREANALNNLAWILALRDKNGAEAMPLAQRAVEVRGEEPSVLDTRAVVCLASGPKEEYEQAVKDMEFVTSKNRTASSYFHLAMAYSQTHQKQKAILTWKRAVELGLSAQKVHPLEVPTYERLKRELE